MKQRVWSLLIKMKSFLLGMVTLAIIVTGLTIICSVLVILGYETLILLLVMLVIMMTGLINWLVEIRDRLKLRDMKARFLDINRKFDDETDRSRRLVDEMNEKDLKIAELRDRSNRFVLSVAEATVKCRDIEAKRQGHATTSSNGILLWRIDDFTIKRQGAVSGVQTAIYSPHFYTSQFGYKMCARVYMNGDGFGKDTHISLFFVVMKGEYDALLPWPFQKKITMMLLDQNNGDHMIDAFRSDAESSSFQRPKNNMNIASGSPLFMPLDGLSNRAYVKDDTMFIKMIVD